MSFATVRMSMSMGCTPASSCTYQPSAMQAITTPRVQRAMRAHIGGMVGKIFPSRSRYRFSSGPRPKPMTREPRPTRERFAKMKIARTVQLKISVTVPVCRPSMRPSPCWNEVFVSEPTPENTLMAIPSARTIQAGSSRSSCRSRRLPFSWVKMADFAFCFMHTS